MDFWEHVLNLALFCFVLFVYCLILCIYMQIYMGKYKMISK